MRRPQLVRRRSIYVPTLFGSLLLLLASSSCALVLLLNVHDFLAVRHSTGNATFLVVEGWLAPAELDQAVSTFRSGRYQRLITTGGPIENNFNPEQQGTFAERAHGYLLRHGVPPDVLVAVPAPQTDNDRTFQSALALRDWLKAQKLDVTELDVFSSGVHCRRSRLLYELAFGTETRIGILPASPHYYDPAKWWRTSNGAKAVLSESIAWIWTIMLFNPNGGESSAPNAP